MSGECLMLVALIAGPIGTLPNRLTIHYNVDRLPRHDGARSLVFRRQTALCRPPRTYRSRHQPHRHAPWELDGTGPPIRTTQRRYFTRS